MRGQGGHNFPGAKSRWERQITVGAPNDCGGAEKSQIVTITSINAEHLLPRDLRFEHWGARLASFPGRHITSLRPCRGAKRFDTRAEFATAWPLEGRMQYDLRDRQQLTLLHCCRQSET